MEDFDLMVKEAKDKGLRIIMDFVPNHSSNEHEWFLKSEQREDPYTDYYLWKDKNESNPGEKLKNLKMSSDCITCRRCSKQLAECVQGLGLGVE